MGFVAGIGSLSPVALARLFVLLAQTLNECRRPFDAVAVLALPPVGGEAAGAGGGEDRLGKRLIFAGAAASCRRAGSNRASTASTFAAIPICSASGGRGSVSHASLLALQFGCALPETFSEISSQYLGV
jgi:hypothetical protein